MRLLLIGAFAYPHVQGSQVYLQEQAIALRAAGVSIELLTYGGGPNLPRALEGFVHTTIPPWTAPRSHRSGPSVPKLLADLALARRLRTCLRTNASGPSRFDAILAHHAEAALAALHALPEARPPVVYCAHTLLGEELPAYSRAPRAALRKAGHALDRWIVGRTDAWIALTTTAERALRAASDRPGRLIPPPIPDPRRDETPARRDDRPFTATLGSHGLEPGRYFLYAGNLDAYQDLERIVAVARARAQTQTQTQTEVESPQPQIQMQMETETETELSEPTPPEAKRSARSQARRRALPIVIATHDERADRFARMSAPLRVVRAESTEEVASWTAAARATIVPRSALGGFPIKLANSLAAGTPVVAYHGDEWGLRDGVDALVCDRTRPVDSLATALARLENDDLARRLRTGARATWEARHRPERAAAAVIELVGELRARGSRSPGA